MGFQNKVPRNYRTVEEVARDAKASTTEPINADRLMELAEFVKAAVDHGGVTPPNWLPKPGSPLEDFWQDMCRGLRVLYWTGMPVPDPVLNESDIPHVWVEPT